MNRDEAHLRNVLGLIRDIEELLIGIDRPAFLESDAVRSAVLLKLIFIGEATRYISDELKARNAGVRWNRIVAFRNVNVHRYWGTDWTIVWNTAIYDAPAYRRQVEDILASEFPSDQDV